MTQLLNSAKSPVPTPSRLLLLPDRDLFALPPFAVWWPLVKCREEEQRADEDDEAPVHEVIPCTERANAPDEACFGALDQYSAISSSSRSGRPIICAPICTPNVFSLP